MISLIAALGRNRAIGRDNQLLWRLPGDLPRFKRMTVGKPVIMGRKTFQSIGKPLPDRPNIVLTRDKSFYPERVLVAHHIEEALELARDNIEEADEIMVIGGAEIYAAFLPRAQRLHLTEVDDAPGADAFFPEFDKTEWREIGREAVSGTPNFAYVTYTR